MSRLRDTLSELAAKHEQLMKTDPLYRLNYEYFKSPTKLEEPRNGGRHYDRDGYCDNPARGY